MVKEVKRVVFLHRYKRGWGNKCSKSYNSVEKTGSFFYSFRYPVVVNLDELVVEIIKAQSFKGFLQMLG
jgi:hypothetical protein